MTIDRVTLNDPEARSADPVAENVAALKALFPAAVADGRIDFDTLRQLLGDEVDDGDERYGLNWPGKRRARRLALTPSTGTLRPAREDSVDWDTTRNLMIEGDNLEVLKLLQKSYSGQVRLIYIDPPYNTGNDFVYPDDFRDSIGNYLRRTGQADEEDIRNSTNPESSGRYHANWLNMILPRLMAAYSLLRKDGAIFVSCDEVEQPNLRALMDGIFGSENFVGDMVWAGGRKNDSQLVSVSHEYMVVYARSIEALKTKTIRWRTRKKGIDDIYATYDRLKKEHGTDTLAIEKGVRRWFSDLNDGHPAKAHKHYRNVDDRGIYFAADISWPGGGGPKYEVKHPVTGKAVKVPSRGWITPDREKMKAWIDDGRVRFGDDENSVPTLKAYLKDQERQAPYSVFYQDGRAATKRLRELMDGDVFNFPKDEGVLQEVVEMASGDEDIVLDFFAGSGTTAHAVMAQNAADSFQRRYILVQLPEPLDPERRDQKAAADFCQAAGKPANIAELTKERLRRASAKIKADTPDRVADLGFRVYKLSTSNLRAWAPGEDLAADLLAAADNIVQGRTEDDLLTELLLKQGIDLTEPMLTETIAGAPVHAMGGGVLIVCLAPVTAANAEALADGIADWILRLKPVAATTVFFKDAGFENDVAKANVAAILEQRLEDQLLKVRSL